MSTNNQSESIIKLMTALSAFQANCPNVPKTKTNPHLKNKYAGLEDIMGTIRQPLRDAGLVVSQLPGDGTLTTLLAHFESGEFVKSTISLAAAKDNNAQAVGSALTYARRYSLSAVLGLAIGEDDDDGHQATKPKDPARKETLTPSHKAWGTAASYIATNGTTRADIEKKYRISDSDWALIVNEATKYSLTESK